ncbi:hypothetical protein Hanom_Chr03g00272341 [Helianthus anomalus]
MGRGKGFKSVMDYRFEKREKEREGGYCGWGPFLSQPITPFSFFLKKNSLPLHQVFKPLPTFFTKV